MFEQKYTRANDRIHPRKELLQELEAKWAEEQARAAEEEQKVVHLRTWPRYVGMAAGIVLCVGLGMGSVLLFGRSRGIQNKMAAAEASTTMDSMMAEEEPRIITETNGAMQNEPEMEDMAVAGAVPEAEKAVSAYEPPEPPKGTHIALDEAEVEDAIRRGELERAAQQAGRKSVQMAPQQEKDGEVPAQAAATGTPTQAPQAKAEAAETDYPRGELLRRDDLITAFQPTIQQAHVVRFADNKLTDVFSLNLQERGAQVKRFFWMGSELLAVREKDGETELLRFGVADWNAPKHRRNLTQSGTFLDAGEVDGRLCVLSLYRATEEEPLPWVDGERMDYDHVLLDGERPGDTFTVITVYDPAQDGLAAQTALLVQGDGVAFGSKELLVWAEGADTALYSFAWGPEGLQLAAETVREETIVSAAARQEGYDLLVQAGEKAALLTLDTALQEQARIAGPTGRVVCGQVFADGAVYLTTDALHVMTAAKTRALPLSGDGFRRLSADRLLVISAAGQLQLVALDRDALEVVSAMEVKEDLSRLVADPLCLDYDPDTGRLVFPAGQKVYQFRIDEGSSAAPRSSSMSFTDHKDAELRELRCLLLPERALIFTKDGVVICNENFVRQRTEKY